MNASTRESLIERALDGTLSVTEQAEFDQLMLEAEFAAAFEAAQSLQALIQSAPEPGFKPFFETRVMARLKQEQSPDGEDLLWRMFPRVSLPAAALAGFFMWTNVAAAAEGTPFVDAMFGLPSSSPDVQLLIGEDNV